MVISLSKKKRIIRPSIIIGSSLAPSHYQIRWYIVNWTLFSLYEDFSRKYRSKCRLQNDSNFGRAALRRHIGLLCTTILRDPEPMPPFRLPRRVSNLLTHHLIMAWRLRPHHGLIPLSAHPPAAGKQASLVSPGYLESCSVRSLEWCLIVVTDLVHLWMSEKTHWILSAVCVFTYEFAERTIHLPIT